MAASGPEGDVRPEGGEPERMDWGRLYEQHYRSLTRFFSQRVPCVHDAEDLVQSVFVSLMMRGEPLQDPETYLWTVARNRLCAYWRRRKQTATVGLPLMLDGARCFAEAACCDYSSDPQALLVRRERRLAVHAMIAHLSPALAQVLHLRFFEGLLPTEAAARAGCERDTLKKRLTRARRSFAEMYRKREAGYARQTADSGSGAGVGRGVAR